MPAQTYPYRVRAGHQLPHAGAVLEAGDLVSLTRAVAAEVRHLVEPVDADGHVLPEPTAEQLELEARPAHEHEGLLLRRRAALTQQLVDLQDIADRTKAVAEAAAAEVARTHAAIDAIDQALEAPVAAPAAETQASVSDFSAPAEPAALAGPARKAAITDSTTSPASPAQKE